jgi:hypothetical protein
MIFSMFLDQTYGEQDEVIEIFDTQNIGKTEAKKLT